MEASGNKENAGALKEPEDKHMRCARTYEDNTTDMEVLVDEQTEEADRRQVLEVNIIEHTNSDDTGLVEAEHQDVTENSSSFGDTVSEVENGAMLIDDEVESELHGDASSALPFDEYGENFRIRRKRLTPHWRKFILPLMWRCKWVELKIKKFQSQAMKYERKLAEYNRTKQFQLENSKLEGFGTKSFPFSGQNQRKEVMRRKKRKRVEDTVDLASYMLCHNLFSYDENKKSAAAASVDNNWGNQVVSTGKTINGNDDFGVNDELLPLDLGDVDNSLEQVLLKIGIVQSQVGKVKIRLDKVMSENAGKFSCTDNLSLLESCNALTSSARNPASPQSNGDTMPVGSSYNGDQLISEYNMGDLLMPETAAVSNGEVNHVSDIIESTDPPEIGGSSKSIGEGIWIYNRRAKEELNDLKEVDIQPVEKLRVSKEEQDSSIPPFHVLEPDLLTDDQPTPKIRSISDLTATKNKRKRGRQKKAGSR